MAQFLGISLEEYQEWLVGCASIEPGQPGYSVGRAGIGGDQPASRIPSSIGRHACSRKAELNRLLVLAVDRLPYPERTVLSLYYLEELTLREIATVMEVHESRVSQLKSQGCSDCALSVDRCWPTRGQAVDAIKGKAARE